MGGIIIEAISILPIFLTIIPNNSPDLSYKIYYIVFPYFYAIGWTAV